MVTMDEFKLIDLIERYPEVWDANSVHFRNKNIKNKGWQTIAEIMGSTVENCQSTWKKLRDRYTRQKRLAPSGSEGGRRKWDKEESLRFLEKTIVLRRTTSNDCRENKENVDSNAIENSVDTEATSDSVSQDTFMESSPECIEIEEIILLDGVSEITEKAKSNEETHRNDETQRNDKTQRNDEIQTEEELETNEEPTPTSSIPNDEAQTSRCTPANAQDKTLPQRTTNARKKTLPQTPSRATSNFKRRKMGESDKDVAESLITAIEKLSNSDAGVSASQTGVNNTFCNYYVELMKNLLEGKEERVQRRIRNRFISFIDELCEEFE